MDKETLQLKIREVSEKRKITVLEKFNFESMAALISCIIFWDTLEVREIK